MPDNVSITVRYAWRADDADGSPCVVCGDVVFMSPMHRLVLRIENARDVELNDVVCDACYRNCCNG